MTEEGSNGEGGEGDDSDCKEPCQNLIHSLGHPKARFFGPRRIGSVLGLFAVSQ